MRRACWVGDRLALSSVKRGVRKAIAAAEVPGIDDKRVRFGSVTPAGYGWVCHVRVPAGSSVTALQRGSEKIAAAMRVKDVQIERDVTDAGIASIRIVETEPFEVNSTSGSSQANRLAIDFADDIDGNLVRLDLTGHHMLIGGVTGAGKNAALDCALKQLVGDQLHRLHLVDPKRVELVRWRPAATSYAGSDPQQILALLEDLVTQMGARYERMAQHDLRQISPEWGRDILIIDELSYVTNTGDRDTDARTEHCLRELVLRGRAAGVTIIAATQKPSGEMMSTAIRDQFSIRFALRCTTAASSDTILGSGSAAAGSDSSSISMDLPGVGYLLAEGTAPVLCRTRYFSDAEMDAEVFRYTNTNVGTEVSR